MNDTQFSLELHEKSVAGVSQNVISGREIWDHFGGNKGYFPYINSQIERLKLKQDIDYVVDRVDAFQSSPGVGGTEANPRGRPRIAHFFTLEAAKSILLLNGSIKARQCCDALRGIDSAKSDSLVHLREIYSLAQELGMEKEFGTAISSKLRKLIDAL